MTKSTLVIVNWDAGQTMSVLVSIALWMQLAGPAWALGSSPSGETHRQEIALLHRAIPRDDLAGLDIWDDKAAEFRPVRPSERVDQLAPVLIVHLFGSWCEPCKAEFPIWRDIGPKLEALHKGKLRIVYVAVQTPPAAMEAFIKAQASHLPSRGPGSAWYSDSVERVANALRQSLPAGKLPMPVSLFLDDQRVVRQAIVGSVEYRRAELVESAERLVKLVTTRR